MINLDKKDTMDTPSGSIFQGTNIDINKSRNDEEEEDLEDQKRRIEEIQNLLMTKLDDFNYDESTMNSSIISAISVNDAQNKFITADTEAEQLKVLYDVRGRELQALRDEYKNVTEKMTKQIDSVKKKLMLSEAELEQLKISYKNSEELLIERTQTIKELSSVLESKEKEIEGYRRSTDNLNLEIATYKSTVDDLYLRIHGDRNPLGTSNKQFNSEELKIAHKEQINKLECLIDEKTRHAKIMERENKVLKEELNKLIDANTDDSNLIKTLTRNFECAQKQCEDLIGVVETLSNENKHLQDRVNNIYNQSPNKRNSLNYNSLTSHVDKLKKMLVDKSVQINTLSAKLNNYEDNLKELLEYRKLKNDVYQKEFQQCDNRDHTKNLLLMQNDLQNYRRMIEDKNQQILHLNSTNKELLAKMEETLSQTRNDIQQFSTKYSLPQLEKMAEDLKNSQNYITQLEEKLKHTESLIQKEEELKEEIENFKLLNEKEKSSFDSEIRKLQNDVSEINSLKQFNKELVDENNKLKNIKNDYESIKQQYLESIQTLHDTQNKMKQLQENTEVNKNFETNLHKKDQIIQQLQETIANLKEKCEVKNKLPNLETELNDAQISLQKKDKTIHQLQETILNLKTENKLPNFETELNNAKISLQKKDKIIHQLQETISHLKKEYEAKNKSLNQKVELHTQKDQIIQQLQETISNLKDAENKSSNLESELKNAQISLKEKDEIIHQLQETISVLKKKPTIEDTEQESNLILELKLREDIQKEYLNNLKEIENKYQKACTSSKDLCKEYVNKLKNQENKFREHLATILSQCTQKIKQLENDRENLIKNIDIIQNEFDNFKLRMNDREGHFRKLIQDIQNKNSREAEKWKLWSQKLVNGCLQIEATNKKGRDNILRKMKKYDANIAAVEKSYEKTKNKLLHKK